MQTMNIPKTALIPCVLLIDGQVVTGADIPLMEKILGAKK